MNPKSPNMEHIMSTIYMIRHGQASFGKKDYDRLSDLGRRQARLLADHFARLGVRFHRIYTGTLRRHLETAEALSTDRATVSSSSSARLELTTRAGAPGTSSSRFRKRPA